jgi:hypothetical protein
MAFTTGLSYDKDGNIQSLSRRFEGLNTYSYTYTSGTNRLASVNKNGSNISFGYDGNGNMKSQSGKFTDIAVACPERSRREHRNLPIHFYLENNEELIANYNADGQRILKESSGGGWSFYVTDGMQTLAVITEQGFLL